MKSVAVILACLAVTALAQNRQCRDEFVRGSKQFTRAADDLVRKHNIDAESMNDCIRNMAKSCSSVVTQQFGSGINNVDEVTLKRCVKSAMGPAKEDMGKCIQKDYPGYEFNGGATKHEGVKVIGLIGVIKEGETACRALTNCLPQNFQDFKKDLCNAKADAFPQNVKNKCPNMEEDLRKTICSCYKGIDNKQEMTNSFKACIGQEDRSLLGRLGGRVVNNVLLKEVEKDTCKKDYTKEYDICEDDRFGKNAGRNNGNNGRSGGLFSGLSGGNSPFGSFGNFGSFNGFGGK